MGLDASGGSTRRTTDGVLYDIAQSLNGPNIQSTLGGTLWTQRGYAPLPSLPAAVPGGVIGFSVGTVHTRIALYVSGASRIVQIMSASAYTIPVNRPTLGNVSTVFSRPLMQYIISVPVRVAPGLRGTADVEVGLMTSNGCLTLLGTSSGAGWASRVGTFGGRWVPRMRYAEGGAMGTDGPDSGILLDSTWRNMAMRYTEGPIAKLEWLIDDVPLHVAYDPPFSGVAVGQGYALACGVGTPAGTTVESGDMRYIAREL